MAISKKKWLYFDTAELPAWAEHGGIVRILKIKDKDADFILYGCKDKKNEKDYTKWNNNRLYFPGRPEGTFEVKPHSPQSIYIAYINADTIKKPKPTQPQPEEPTEGEEETDFEGEPPFDPLNDTEVEARRWLLWREIKLLRKGKVPQGWASVSASIIEKMKEEDKRRGIKPPKQIEVEELPDEIESEIKTLHKIILNLQTSPKDKMAAQARLKEIDAKTSKNPDYYDPEPVFVAIPDPTNPEQKEAT